MINMSGVMQKVDKFAKSADGKKRMEKKILEYVVTNVEYTQAGSKVVTINTMCNIAEEMINILKECASIHIQSGSVIDHFNSLTYNKPVLTNKGAYVEIFFSDNLSRLSLLIVNGSRAGQRTGEGIDNIVSLFNTGYSNGKIGSVEGLWDGHEELGVISNRTWLDGEYFLEEAIDNFNTKYGTEYNVYAKISDTWPDR